MSGPIDLEHLDHRAGPAVRDDQRQRVLVLRLHVDEVDVEPVDLGDELRELVQPRLEASRRRSPRPVARERLERRQLHALRRVVHELLAGPARRRDAPAQVVELLFRHIDAEGADLGSVSTVLVMTSSVVGSAVSDDLLSSGGLWAPTPAGRAQQQVSPDRHWPPSSDFPHTGPMAGSVLRGSRLGLTACGRWIR